MTESTPGPDHSFLDRYAGPKPPRHGFNPSIPQHAMTLIGYIGVQWGALGFTLDLQIKFKRNYPEVPEEVRKKRVRREAKHEIGYLRELGQYIYRDKRANALKEFETILDQITRLKGPRDQLVHGIFALNDNQDPSSITVHYKRKKYTHSLDRLLKIGIEIGEANGALGDFDSWVNYERTLSLMRKLDEQGRQ